MALKPVVEGRAPPASTFCLQGAGEATRPGVAGEQAEADLYQSKNRSARTSMLSRGVGGRRRVVEGGVCRVKRARPSEGPSSVGTYGPGAPCARSRRLVKRASPRRGGDNQDALWLGLISQQGQIDMEILPQPVVPQATTAAVPRRRAR